MQAAVRFNVLHKALHVLVRFNNDAVSMENASGQTTEVCFQSLDTNLLNSTAMLRMVEGTKARGPVQSA